MGLTKRRWMEALEAEGKHAQWECPVCEEPNISDFEIPEVNFFLIRQVTTITRNS
jgi:hypothetical protein